MKKHYKISMLLFLNIAFNNALVNGLYYKKHRNSSFNATLPSYQQHLNSWQRSQKNKRKRIQQENDSLLSAQNNQQYLDSFAIFQRIKKANDQRTNNIIAIATQKAQSMALYN